MLRNISLVSVLVLLCGGAFAGGGNNVSKYIDVWGGGKWNNCQEHGMVGSKACIGQSELDNCEPTKMYARDYTDEWAVQMMVALKVTEYGAYFCPVQIEGKNENKSNAWTEYAQAGTNCVWLCREGYTGEDCSRTVDSVVSCDPTPLIRSDYSDLERVPTGTNIEDSVAMFAFNQYEGCGVNKGQEHDMILGIVDWTESGHGAWVQQLVVRAQRSGWGSMVSWASINPASGASKILVCKNGYRQSGGSDCVPINQTLCIESQTCSGWTGYDETKHRFVLDNGCYEFRCKEEGLAFASETDRSCVPCVRDARTGVLSENGVCQKCEVGKFFKDDVNTPCGTASAYSKLDMQYGKGNTGKTKDLDLKDQCWTMVSPDEYKKCVVEGTKSQTE